MDELMRLCLGARFHFVECGAKQQHGWANVAVPTVQYTHGMLSCSEFTGVPLRTCWRCAVSTPGRPLVLPRPDGAGMSRTIPMSLIESGRGGCWPGARNARCCARPRGYPLRLVVPGVQG